MQITCDSNREIEPPTGTASLPSGFVGYKFIKKQEIDVVRIYLNCKDESHFGGTVDVIFEDKNPIQKEGRPKFSGLSELSTIKKFNRFIGCLEERAREEKIPRERIFESPKQLLYLLSRVKNSKNFQVEKR